MISSIGLNSQPIIINKKENIFNTIIITRFMTVKKAKTSNFIGLIIIVVIVFLINSKIALIS